MKTSELITVLQARLRKHGDVEVVTTWESIQVSIAPPNVYLSTDGRLYIDADENSYKRDFAADPTEGESS